MEIGDDLVELISQVAIHSKEENREDIEEFLQPIGDSVKQNLAQ